MQDYVLATIYEGIDEEAGARGYVPFVTNSHDDPALRRARISQMRDRRVEALIICDSPIDDPPVSPVA